jgi:leucyl aminopeptidase
MIDILVSKKSVLENEVEAYAFFLKEGFALSSDLKKIERNHMPHLKKHLDKHGFKGRVGESFVFSAAKNADHVHYVFVGIGKQTGPSHERVEAVRRGVGALVAQTKKLRFTDVAVDGIVSGLGIDAAECVKQITITAFMAAYEFTTFKSSKKEKQHPVSLMLCVDSKRFASCKKAVAEGVIIGEAVNSTRHFADLPPNILTPTKLANEAQKIAKEYGLKSTVFGREKALKLGMGGFCSVDEGSDQDGKFIILEYTAKASAPTIALVGKGVTFDSGGISLKPASYMTGMKYDMSGASAVIGAMKAIAQLKPKVNVVGIAPAVENLPSGKCNKQDDIITFMNGKTAEIENTDAEGRLVLADALCYAEKYYSPKYMIDIATLTGACVVALGHFFTACITPDDSFAQSIEKAGKASGDRIWRLPMHDDFKGAIESDTADLQNCGKSNYGGGTITAGLFLKNFVDKAVWAHLDIAGTADGVPGVNYKGKGATGVGVRLFVEFVMRHVR